MKKSTLFVTLCLAIFGLGACAVEEPINPPPVVQEDAGVQDAAPDTAPLPVCKAATDCPVAQNECEYTDCQIGACAVLPQPQGTPCEVGNYPNKTCNGHGVCAFKPATQGCITASTEGDPATDCDDGNPCTQDSVVDGVCHHGFIGLGSACGLNGMQDGECKSGGVGEQCCPVFPATDLKVCAVDGEQDACAEGSVCLGGLCWIACDDVGGTGCATAPWHTCAPKTAGMTTAYICQ